MSSERILIVEDDASTRDLLATILKKAGCEIQAVPDGRAAIEAAKAAVFHLYLIDHCLPGPDGIEVLKGIQKINSEAICIILTGFGTIDLSVRAMKAGAYDFITKPFQSDLVLARVKNALDHGRLKRENRILQKTTQEKYRLDDGVVKSPAMKQVYDLAKTIADSDSTVLLQGESGTGKEVIARTIHYNSPRRDKPMIPINCGAIPEALLESELFGHEKGAFTGATSSRIGRFEMAHGSTLFLDEIGEMPLSLQVKLLRVIQEREFERVGGTKSVQVDVRIISATNQDLEEAVSEKRFRKDLFYRLNVIPIYIPPLRERKEDIPVLIRHFLEKFNKNKTKKTEGISPEATEVLLQYPWPGNVRELENLIERLTTLKREGAITVDDLPPKYTRPYRKEIPSLLEFPADFPEDGIDFCDMVSRFEDHLLEMALLKTNGIKSRAAELLRMNRTTLVEKIKKRANAKGAFAFDSPASKV